MLVNLIEPPFHALRTLYTATRQCTAYTPEPIDDEHPEDAIKVVLGALKSGHDSILEHVSFTFRIQDVSRACTHQLVRHRMASYCQVSQRYVNARNADTVYPFKIQNNPELYQEAVELVNATHNFYDKCIANGVPKEDARYFLPEGTHTAIVCTMNGRELVHFFNLRCCFRAQWEIRTVAWKMLKKCQKWLPWLFENVGPQCWRLGHCPEQRKCPKYDPNFDMLPKDYNYHTMKLQKEAEESKVIVPNPDTNTFGITKSIYTMSE